MKTSRVISAKNTLLLLLLLALVLSAGLTWAIHRVMQGNTPGMDFYIFWLAGRAALTGGNPYGDDIGVAVQLGTYDHLSGAGQNQMLFAYPPYALLAVLPFLALPFDWAQAAWLSVNLIALAATYLALKPVSPLRSIAGGLLFFPVAFALILGNFVVLIGAILLLVLTSMIQARQHSPAGWVALGILLAWTTIKPQFSWLFLAFIAVWVLRSRTWHLAWGFLGGLVTMLALSFVVVPDWLSLWLGVLQKYTTYHPAEPALATFLNAWLPHGAAQPLTIVIIAVIAALTLILFRRWWQGRETPLRLLAWLGLAAYLLAPQSVSYEQVRFLLPLFLWAAMLPAQNRWQLWIFFWGGLLVSWGVFVIERTNISFALNSGWRLLYHLGWLIWLFWPYTRRKS